MFAFGFFVGALFVAIVEVVAFYVLTKNRSSVVRMIAEGEKVITTKAREKMSIIKHKTPEDEAWEHIRKINEHRGGIPDSELH